jgi:hypothetical protein
MTKQLRSISENSHGLTLGESCTNNCQMETGNSKDKITIGLSFVMLTTVNYELTTNWLSIWLLSSQMHLKTW